MLRRRNTLAVLGSVLVTALLSDGVRAQCQEWSADFQIPKGGVNDGIRAQVLFNDGTGTKLYVGGEFTSTSKGPANHVARFDGTSFSALGAGTNGPVYALAVFDAGNGPALYAAGSFTTAGGVAANNVARWNGTSWSALGAGTSNQVFALAVFDDGTGPALYAAGIFGLAGGAPANRIARWDGEHWSALGNGLDDWGRALCVFDDGTGAALYAGGAFDNAGPSPASKIARWNGTTWSGLGLGVNADVFAVAVFDAGTGPMLYAGGDFTTAGGTPASRIARWNGASWSALPGGGVTDTVFALCAYTDFNGASLYVGGHLGQAGGSFAERIARWDGAQWYRLDGSLHNGPVRSMIGWDDGSGRRLYAGGFFTAAGVAPGLVSPVGFVASWDGTRWAALAPSNGTNGAVRALAVYDGGGGSELYAGGVFSVAGGAFADHIARFDGESWSTVGGGTNNTVDALLAHDDGTGLALYAAGYFTLAGELAVNGVARWNGTSWSAVGAGVPGGAFSLLVFDDGGGPALFAGSSSGMVKWDGANWTVVGTSGTPGYGVHPMAVFDDGNGPALYAGGGFTAVSGVPANHIAKWDGATWSALGAGTDARVYCMQTFDDGSGNALYAGGYFTQAGGAGAFKVARWDGANWSTVGSVPDQYGALAMTVFDDSTGPALYVGSQTNGLANNEILYRWDGTSWTSLGAGTGGFNRVEALIAYDDGDGTPQDLYMGGDFDNGGNQASWNIAKYESCVGPGVPFCAGDGTTAPCPCLDNGETGHGCQNSASTGGAFLYTYGTTSPDTVLLHVFGELPTALTIFLQGNAEIGPVTFGDGLRCTGGLLKRLYVKSASGGATSAPAVGDASITDRSAALGDPIAPGSVRLYQTYYRDANPGWCLAPPATFNASGGVRITW